MSQSRSGSPEGPNIAPSCGLTFCLRSLHLLQATLERDRLLGRGLLSASNTMALNCTLVARSVASA